MKAPIHAGDEGLDDDRKMWILIGDAADSHMMMGWMHTETFQVLAKILVAHNLYRNWGDLLEEIWVWHHAEVSQCYQEIEAQKHRLEAAAIARYKKARRKQKKERKQEKLAQLDRHIPDDEKQDNDFDANDEGVPWQEEDGIILPFAFGNGGE